MAKGRKQRYVLYGVFMAFVLAVLFLGQKLPRDNPVSYMLIETAAPALNVFRAPVHAAQTAIDNLGYYIFVAETNKKLRQQNARLTGWRREALHLRHENQQLRSLLDMAEDLKTNPVAARVLADTRSPYARTVLIDTGTANGVEKGQAVLSHAGLAGRVLEVAESTSRVLLLGDHNARIPVKLAQSGTLAIAKGGRYQAMDIVLSDGTLEAKAGEAVVTSGIGGVFASGLPVGVVVKSGGVYKVQPHTNFATLDKVVVHKRPVNGILESEAYQDEGRLQ